MELYKNGKIYTIRSKHTEKYYIGSTCCPLTKRLNYHKNSYTNYLTGMEKYYSSFELYALGDVYIELLENYPCKTKDELLKREGELQRNHIDNIINSNIAGRTIKQWRIDNKEQTDAKVKEYYIKNKKAIEETKKKWNDENKEKVLKRQAEWREKNREKIREQARQFRERQKNKTKN